MKNIALVLLPNPQLSTPTMHINLGVLYIASTIKDAGHDVKVVDLRGEKDVCAVDLGRIRNVDCVCLSATSGEIKFAKKLNKLIKEINPDTKTIIGGAHASLYPKDCNEFDAVVVGEGEKIIVDIIENNLTGLFKQKRIKNLDELPSPDWDLLSPEQMFSETLLPGEKYGKGTERGVTLIGSRGCPFNCAFCIVQGSKIILAEKKNKLVENVIVGDKLVAWDERKKELTQTIVENIFIRSVNRYYKIKLNDSKTLKVTGEHPIYTKRGWVNAKDITTKDELWTIDFSDKISVQKRFYNPMKNSGVVNRNSGVYKVEKQKETVKKRIKEGKIIPYFCTEKGRKQISRIAKERAIKNNPMKNPIIAHKCAISLIEGGKFKGNKHPNWKGGISVDPYCCIFSLKEFKEILLERDNYKCQNPNCNKKTNRLCVHHIDYDKKNCRLDNLITLCVSCNSKANFNREYYKKTYFDLLTSKCVDSINCPHFVGIESIEEKILDEPKKVYNFHCSPHNNYYAEYILVHNCANIHRAPVTFLSPEKMYQEVKLLCDKYNVRSFRFVDDMFTLNKKWLKDVCERFATLDIKYRCHTRADSLTTDDVALLKNSGCVELAIGVESGDPKVLKIVNKKETVNQFTKAVNMIRDSGISTKVYLMSGLPGETEYSLEHTFNFMVKARPDKWTLSQFTPYPGCAIWRNPAKYGVKIVNTDFENYWNFTDEVTYELIDMFTPEMLRNRYRTLYKLLRSDEWKK